MSSRPNFVDPLAQRQDALKANKRSGTAGSITQTSGPGKTTAAALAAEQHRHALREAEDEEGGEWDPDGDDASRIQSVRFKDPLEAVGAAAAGAKGKAWTGKDLGVGGGVPCAGCGKSVGFAEKLVFQEKVWHRGTCFRCHKCDVPLMSQGEALEGDGKATCKACHTKHFAGPSKRY